MHECMDLGGRTPPSEDCAQVGSEGYHDRALRECRAYVALLRRVMGDEPDGARLSVKSSPHDFGSYLTVCVFYDPAVSAAVDYAFACEAGGPREWDDAARRELGISPNPSVES